MIRISPARALILAALSLVFVVEGRTVLGFFGVEVSAVTAAVTALVVIALLGIWALWSERTSPDR